MLLAAAPAATIEGAAGTAIYSIIKDSVFGALLVAAVVLLVWLIRRTLAVQDARVDDQKQMAERLEKAQQRQGEIIEKMTEAFGSFKSSVDGFKEAQRAGNDAIHSVGSKVQGLTTIVDGVIRDAVRRSRSGGYSSVRERPPSDPPGTRGT